MFPRRAVLVFALLLAACARAVDSMSEAPEPLVVRTPLEGLARGTRTDTLAALVARRDSLDVHVNRLVQQRIAAKQALAELAAGDRLASVSTSATNKGAMSDRFRDEVRTEMSASRLVEHEKAVAKKLEAAFAARDALCSELAGRREGTDPRRCTAI